ncbi:hypothetical protein GCM10017566_52150 [Amycolatopsis bartoniae]|uniref:Tyr recombinase domain-containing protein n=1 Tax=Amycolatopsis bartoniae TaxID=941986 RepID=A0A8H9J131_9PSEU|nr:hypothetical protein GCM10017566_52150 [Amycolatopsis bartoniae]
MGSLPLAQVRNSHIRGWVKDRAQHLAPSTLATVYHGVLVPMFNAAVIDKRIGTSPCVGVRLPEIPDARYYIAKPEQVHALYQALPERYRAIVYLAAGCGWRGGEIFGLEQNAIDFEAREVHVRQVDRGRRATAVPRSAQDQDQPPDERAAHRRSRRASDAPGHVPLRARGDRGRDRPPPADRAARRPRVHPRRWPSNPPSRLVIHLAPSRRGCWPAERLRTTGPAALLRHGPDLRRGNVKTVQFAMGHTTPTVTLNTYVGYWPDAVDQTRSLVDSALGCTGDVPEAA